MYGFYGQFPCLIDVFDYDFKAIIIMGIYVVYHNFGIIMRLFEDDFG